MTPATQKRSQKMRNKILLAAAEEIEHKGYLGMSFGSVADAAQVQKSHVQYYFPAKAEVVRAIMSEVFQGGRYLGGASTGDLRGLQAIAVQNQRVTKASIESPLARAALRLLDERNTLPLEVPVPYLGWIQRLGIHLQEAIDDGEIPPPVLSVDHCARLIVAAAHGVKHVAAQLGETDDLPQLADEMLIQQFTALGSEEPRKHFTPDKA